MLVVILGCGAPPAMTLRLPMRCVVGEDCWITSRPDVDPGDGARDHAGDSHTYDGHDGTDVAVRHVGQADATWVTAPIAGTILRVRDAAIDGRILAGGLDAVEDRECGNGAVIDAGDGWTVLLCHLRWGTMVVRPGDHVDVGDRLGRMGWSGKADHPHVHLTLSQRDRKVDPFTGRWLDDGTPALPGPAWTLPAPAEMDSLTWAGFDAGPRPDPDIWPIDGERGVVPASATSLVLGVFLWRPEEGDVVGTEITRPDGTTSRSEIVQPRDRPRQTWWVEKTWPADERPVGLWTAKVTWRRGERARELRASAVVLAAPLGVPPGPTP